MTPFTLKMLAMLFVAAVYVTIIWWIKIADRDDRPPQD